MARPKSMKTEEIESAFKKAGYQAVQAYHYNSASIRVRVIDKKFVGKSRNQREKAALKVIHSPTGRSPDGHHLLAAPGAGGDRGILDESRVRGPAAEPVMMFSLCPFGSLLPAGKPTIRLPIADP